ncbi:hypothetical protein KM043_001102 [Ampulex compressa]|nr:hypothetical protein KM043_001102 [Ampulex compressa]
MKFLVLTRSPPDVASSLDTSLRDGSGVRIGDQCFFGASERIDRDRRLETRRKLDACDGVGGFLKLRPGKVVCPATRAIIGEKRMDGFYRKMQMLLMRRNQEYGELRFLTSRTTPENAASVDELCLSVMDVFETCGVPLDVENLRDEERAVQAFKYLVLNTNFTVQRRLEEDVVHGHLVDMCPPLSPFLLMQITWGFEYEKVLAESILHSPVDLCNEILEAVRSCINELPFQREMDFLLELAFNTYRKLMTVRNTGLQSSDPRTSIDRITANFEELLLLLESPKVIRLKELPTLQRYKRCGFILKDLIRVARKCLESQTSVDKNSALEKLYKISFGREPFQACEETHMEETLQSINQALMNALLKKIKEIDCNMYMAWSEIDDVENCAISLQRSIGNDCYHFLEFLKKDQSLSQESHLIECLQQLASKPENTTYVLSLQELCHEIQQGRKEYLKELMTRYKEWQPTMLSFIAEQKASLDKNDCSNLLEYLTFLLLHSEGEDYKELAYSTITEIVFLRSIPDIYEIAVEYITKHDGRNCLESRHTEDTFEHFIRQNSNLRTPKNLKIILLFLLRSPKKVLTILLKIAIGYPEYSNILISPGDLLLLSPFLSIRDENNRPYLSAILKSVCLESTQWHPKKLMDLLRVMIDRSIIEGHELVNNVFVPYLDSDSFNASNLKSILANIRQFQSKCTRETNTKELIVSLARRMASLRRNSSLLKYTSSEIFSQIVRILEYFLEIRANALDQTTRRSILRGIEALVEPVDKIHFSHLWHLLPHGASVLDIVEDYERRCCFVTNRIKEDASFSEGLRSYLSDVSLLREDFLRHLISRTTELEFQKVACEVTIMYWFMFGWENEMEAYDHLLRLTMETCSLTLEYPSAFPRDSFAFLLSCLLRFCRDFVRLESLKDTEVIYRSTIRNVRSLEESVRSTRYKSLFTDVLARAFRIVDQDYSIQELLMVLQDFSGQCLELSHELPEEDSGAPTRRISSFYASHQFISACMRMPAVDAYECIGRLDALFA